MRIPTFRGIGIQTGMLRPAQEHLGAALGDVVISEVASMDAARVDVVAGGRGGGFVEDLLFGPGVVEDVLDIVIVVFVVVGGRGGAGGEGGDDGVRGLEIAVVKGVVRVGSQVDHDEGLVIWGVEHFKVHNRLFDEEGGCSWGQLAGSPGVARPVFILEEETVSQG